MLERCFSLVPYPLDDVRRALVSDLDAWLPTAVFDAAHARHALWNQLGLDDPKSAEPADHPNIQVGEVRNWSAGCAVSFTWNPPGAEQVFGTIAGQFALLPAGSDTLLALSVTYRLVPSLRRSRSARLKVGFIVALAGRTFLDIAERSVRVRLDPRWAKIKAPANT